MRKLEEQNTGQKRSFYINLYCFFYPGWLSFFFCTTSHILLPVKSFRQCCWDHYSYESSFYKCEIILLTLYIVYAIFNKYFSALNFYVCFKIIPDLYTVEIDVIFFNSLHIYAVGWPLRNQSVSWGKSLIFRSKQKCYKTITDSLILIPSFIRKHSQHQLIVPRKADFYRVNLIILAYRAR